MMQIEPFIHIKIKDGLYVVEIKYGYGYDEELGDDTKF